MPIERLRMKGISATVLSVALALATACSDKNPSGPGDDGNKLTPAGMVVSDPLASSSRSSSIGVNGSASLATSPLAYVSAVPGTFPGGLSAAIRNKTKSGTSQSVPVTDGGFDPVH